MIGIVPYHPLLHLEDSQIAAYKIYVLKNPITDEIFYVGQTVLDLSERLSGHINQTGGINRGKINYIKSIIDAGFKPTIHEIETIHSTCYVDKLAITEREAYWIKYYRGIGCNLLNIANPQAYEYKNYLSSLLRGETKWHYYYCGKTLSGERVYDTKRIELDGISLPIRPVCGTEYSPPSFKYDPWENPRFVKKMGYVKDPYEQWAYVPCYNDTNPEYYDEDY
jgi:hypothetical protein